MRSILLLTFSLFFFFSCGDDDAQPIDDFSNYEFPVRALHNGRTEEAEPQVYAFSNGSLSPVPNDVTFMDESGNLDDIHTINMIPEITFNEDSTAQIALEFPISTTVNASFNFVPEGVLLNLYEYNPPREIILKGDLNDFYFPLRSSALKIDFMGQLAFGFSHEIGHLPVVEQFDGLVEGDTIAFIDYDINFVTY